MKRLSKIFKIISFFDDCRWSKKGNYNSINFFSNNLDADSKLLTHWLCYISDRQMSFEIIWDVGGFIFSEIVQEIKQLKNIAILDHSLESSYVKEGDGGKYYFISKENANGRIVDEYENYINRNKVRFKPRFLPSDYMCILSTLVTLENFDYSLSKYIHFNFIKNKDENDIITRLLFSLYLLTYYEIGQYKSADLSKFKTNCDCAKRRNDSVMAILNNKQKFDSELQKFKKDKIFRQKRAWCSFRDFIKSPEFHPYFKKAMLQHQDITNSDIESLKTKKSLEQFVLPGDVWNNNSIFGKCILSKTHYENNSKSLNVILDEYFKKERPEIGYSEQFDVTFDFVPRMCEKKNCDICPIKNIDLKNDIEKLCANNKEKYCTVALCSCNYKSDCVGRDNCKLFN